MVDSVTNQYEFLAVPREKKKTVSQMKREAGIIHKRVLELFITIP